VVNEHDGPTRPRTAELVPLVYLDLNHWVNLTRARLGRSGTAAHRELLDELEPAVAAGRVTVPLSGTHYIELSRIRDPRQRAEVALTMGGLSRYAALTWRGDLLRHQLRQALAKELGVDYSMPDPARTGHGFAHAFGQPPVVGRLRGDPAAIAAFVEHHGHDFIDRLANFAGYGWRFTPSGRSRTASELLHEATDAVTQFIMLRGPGDEDVKRLASGYGYRPEASYEVTDRIARREAELASALAAKPGDKRRLDDIIAARALFWDLNELWIDAFAALKTPLVTFEQIGKPGLERILDGIPVVIVESAVRRGSFRNGAYRWSTNDVYDISFLGTAVSLCDVLLSEKHVQTQLIQQGIDRRYGVRVLRRPEELTEWLRSSGP
jgi:hypothetical protein